MSYIATIIFYNLILVISLYFSKTYLYKTKGQAIISFLIVFLMSALRFDIGNDYQVQAEKWDAISQLLNSGFSLKDLIILKGKEPFALFLCFLFKNSQYPSAYVFFIYALIFTFLIFKAFNDNNKCFTSGIFALFTMLFLFFSWDWTRQGVAYAIGLFSLKYVRKGSLGRFLLCVLLAISFHSSAVVLIFLYSLRFFNIKRSVSIVLVVIFTILAYLGLFDSLFTRIVNAFGFLYENYVGSDHSIQFKETSASITVLFHSLITILIIYFIPEKEKLLRNAITIGSVIFIISSQNLLLERVSYYYYIFIILAFQYLDQLKCSKYKLNRIAYYMLFFIMILYYNYAIINIGGTRGAVPYDSILLENFDTGNYRYRKFRQF